MPEIQDLRSSVKTLSEIGDFSTIGFTMIGLGEPREVNAGVVSGSFCDYGIKVANEIGHHDHIEIFAYSLFE